MLNVSRINQSYGGSHTLWDVDLEVKPGSRTCLMGRNGMGKTTLLKCVMGLIRSQSGAMTFKGTTLTSLPAEARARLGIAQGNMWPQFQQASEWAMKRLTEWGLTNVHQERWPFGKGWTMGRDMPAPAGRTFRDLYRQRETKA